MSASGNKLAQLKEDSIAKSKKVTEVKVELNLADIKDEEVKVKKVKDTEE